MRIVRVFHANRLWLSLALLALVALASGCGGSNVNTQPAAPATTQAEQDKERAAREKAMLEAKQAKSKPATPPAK